MSGYKVRYLYVSTFFFFVFLVCSNLFAGALDEDPSTIQGVALDRAQAQMLSPASGFAVSSTRAGANPALTNLGRSLGHCSTEYNIEA